MRLVHSSRYDIDIGPHVYPTRKYRLIVEELERRGALRPDALVEPEPASWAQLALVHTSAYLDQARTGAFTPAEQARLELPWSPAIAEGFRLMAGGTLVAARLALTDGIAVHVGGGFHHAFAGHGEGFCLFNDVALAVRVLQQEGAVVRAAIVDVDVHHGNGTAAIFRDDDRVFTCSLHQERNYPVEKPRGSLDIGLADGTGDDRYHALLREAMAHVLASRPDLVVYLAGADPYLDDQLGGLALTAEGLRERDRIVFDACRRDGRPVAVTLAGGYARRIADTVSIHVATIEAAAASFDRRWSEVPGAGEHDRGPLGG